MSDELVLDDAAPECPSCGLRHKTTISEMGAMKLITCPLIPRGRIEYRDGRDLVGWAYLG